MHFLFNVISSRLMRLERSVWTSSSRNFLKRLTLLNCRPVNVSVQYARDRLAGLVVKASASRVEDQGFESRLRGDISGSSHTRDLKIGTPAATLPGAWRYRISARTGRPGVSILGEVESLICSFYLRVAARKTVCAEPSVRYTSVLLER